MKLLATAVIMLCALSQVASAQRGGQDNRRLVVDYYDQEFRGRGNLLYLKKAIKRNYPRIDFSRFKLKRVRLVAKSARGRGQAALLAGGSWTSYKTVDGYPRDYQYNDPSTYSRLDFFPNSQQNGPWQVELNGQIKVKRVVVILQRKRGGGGGGRVSPAPYCTVQNSKKPNPHGTCTWQQYLCGQMNGTMIAHANQWKDKKGDRKEVRFVRAHYKNWGTGGRLCRPINVGRIK